jgi:hypothetical protein
VYCVGKIFATFKMTPFKNSRTKHWRYNLSYPLGRVYSRPPVPSCWTLPSHWKRIISQIKICVAITYKLKHILPFAALSKKLTTMWSNFVKTGDPTPRRGDHRGDQERAAWEDISDIVWKPVTSTAAEVSQNYHNIWVLLFNWGFQSTYSTVCMKL